MQSLNLKPTIPKRCNAMKYMIASDIHGSAHYCRALLSAFEREGCARLILLGDILYHGPRNDLPVEYAPKEVISMLNPLSDKILCVRGNCDADVDQMVLTFPIMADYAIMEAEGHLIYMSHGHIHGEDNPPPLAPGDILLGGHTHVPRIAAHGAYTYLNPGSTSLPKENSPHSYVTLEGGVFIWKNLDSGEEYMRFDVRG